MKGNKKDGGKRGRGRRHFSSPKEASYIASAALPSLTLPYLIPFSSCLFRCRSAYWGAIVASPENTRRAWKRVRRSSPLNGEQKNSPFSFSRCKPVHSCTLFAECFESTSNREMGFDKQLFRRTKIRESWNWKIREIGTDLFIYLFFSKKFFFIESGCSYAARK